MSKGKKKTRAELLIEIQFLKRARAATSFVSVFNNLIRWTGIVLIAYLVFCSIEALAGKSTLANIGVGVGFFGKLNLSYTFSFLFGIGGVGYGWRQRMLRRRTIEHFQERNKQLETAVDPRRSSSGLTARGDTRPEDRE